MINTQTIIENAIDEAIVEAFDKNIEVEIDGNTLKLRSNGQNVYNGTVPNAALNAVSADDFLAAAGALTVIATAVTMMVSAVRKILNAPAYTRCKSIKDRDKRTLCKLEMDYIRHKAIFESMKDGSDYHREMMDAKASGNTKKYTTMAYARKREERKISEIKRVISMKREEIKRKES